MVADRFSRNVALFGREGQERIARARVGIVGLGGLGSHVSQQLAHLGVVESVYVDHDLITWSSLNRVVTGVETDVGSTPKVEAAARRASEVHSEAGVMAIEARLGSEEAHAALTHCSSVFGCLDSDLARVELIEFCVSHRVPFFDLATDTGEGEPEPWYGGRVLFSGYGERCPSCMDLLNQEAMTRSSMSEEELLVDDRLYGVSRGALGATGPSVVSLNGVVASLAVMEWMVWTTGLRQPKPLIEYRGAAGAVFVSEDPPKPGCYYCARWGRVRSRREDASRSDAASREPLPRPSLLPIWVRAPLSE